MSNEDLRPNFGMNYTEGKACKECKMVAHTEDLAAYCMAGAAEGTPTEQGKRINENFTCDNFSAK